MSNCVFVICPKSNSHIVFLRGKYYYILYPLYGLIHAFREREESHLEVPLNVNFSREQRCYKEENVIMQKVIVLPYFLEYG